MSNAAVTEDGLVLVHVFHSFNLDETLQKVPSATDRRNKGEHLSSPGRAWETWWRVTRTRGGGGGADLAERQGQGTVRCGQRGERGRRMDPRVRHAARRRWRQGQSRRQGRLERIRARTLKFDSNNVECEGPLRRSSGKEKAAAAVCGSDVRQRGVPGAARRGPREEGTGGKGVRP